MLGFGAGAVSNLGLAWERTQQAPTTWASSGRLRRDRGGWGPAGGADSAEPGPCPLTVPFPAHHAAA